MRKDKILYLHILIRYNNPQRTIICEAGDAQSREAFIKLYGNVYALLSVVIILLFILQQIVPTALLPMIYMLLYNLTVFLQLVAK